MRKKIIFLSLFLSVFYFVNFVHGEDYNGTEVYVSIESYDKTLAHGRLNAYTFEDAIKKLALKNNVEIITRQNGSFSEIYSVGQIKHNTFSAADGWFGYILRNNLVVSPDEYMNMALEKDDHVVLYYGDHLKTKLITSFELNVEDKAIFHTESNYTKWSENNGEWTDKVITENLNDVKIHVYVPGDVQKIIKTNMSGKASINLDKLGVYKYYAEGYAFNGTPSVVKTMDYYYLHGVKNPKQVSREEAATFVVNHFLVENPSSNEASTQPVFSDMTNKSPYFDEINTAFASGLISGYDDGTFRPNEKITLLQLTIILSRANPIDEPARVTDSFVDGVPSYAQDSVRAVLDQNLLDGVDKNWSQPVTADILMQIYLNAQ